MQTHVKVLGVLYLAVSAGFLVLAFFLLLVMGGTAGIVGAAADAEDAAIAIPVLGIAGTALAIFLVTFALPGLVTGYGLLNFKPWARILGIVLSALNLINIPFGTVLGAYGLWVLLSSDTERLFENRPTVTSTPI
ncbi:MAG: hypothetical protein V7647_2950 [Acidobacteriota bacterium]|jgi:hypothetical protein